MDVVNVGLCHRVYEAENCLEDYAVLWKINGWDS